MDIITVNVGQGSLAIIRNGTDAIIVDAHIPPSGNESVAYVKGILAAFLKGFFVRGLILTGFDRDHSDATGVGLILKKYRPDWVMYPKYYKDTDSAKNVFKLINEEEKDRQGSSSCLKKISCRLDKIDSRKLNGLSQFFSFELFSPHPEDMDSSNNSGIVIRLQGTGALGFSYLITGDTENDRWITINRLFGSSLKSDIMAAPHHGSRTGANAETLLHVQPDTILISAGVDNQYGHPDSQAVAAFCKVARQVYCTYVNGGASLITSRGINGFKTDLIN